MLIIYPSDFPKLEDLFEFWLNCNKTGKRPIITLFCDVSAWLHNKSSIDEAKLFDLNPIKWLILNYPDYHAKIIDVWNKQ